METRRARIRDIFFVATGATPKSTDPEHWNGDIPWVTPDDLSHCDGATTSGGARFLTEDGYASCGTTLVPQGAIVISTRAPIGYVAVADNFLCFNQGCKALVPRSNEDSRYWRYVITAERAGLTSFGRGSTYAELSTQALKDYPVEWPLVDEQRQVAAFLDEETARVDELVAEKARFVELLAEKRAALITHGVTKGLDPDADMKDSGVEWLGEVPAGWNAGPITRHSRLESGHTPSRQHPEWWTDCDLPWFTTSDVGQVRDGRKKYVEQTAECVSRLGLANSSARELPAGTVMLSRTASVGFSAIAAVPMATSQDFANWVCGEELLPEYLLYSLRAMSGEFRRLSYGSTHKTIYMPDIRRLAIAFPPFREQQAIAEYLDHETALIDELADATRGSIALLREYRSALISAAVTGKIDVSAHAATQGDSQ